METATYKVKGTKVPLNSFKKYTRDLVLSPEAASFGDELWISLDLLDLIDEDNYTYVSTFTDKIKDKFSDSELIGFEQGLYMVLTFCCYSYINKEKQLHYNFAYIHLSDPSSDIKKLRKKRFSKNIDTYLGQLVDLFGSFEDSLHMRGDFTDEDMLDCCWTPEELGLGW